MKPARVINRMPQFVEAVQQRAARSMTQALIIGGSEVAGLTPRDRKSVV